MVLCSGALPCGAVGRRDPDGACVLGDLVGEESLNLNSLQVNAAARDAARVAKIERGAAPVSDDIVLGDRITSRMTPRMSWAITGLVMTCLLAALVGNFATRWAYGKDDLGLARLHSILQKVIVCLLVMLVLCAIFLLVDYFAGVVLQKLISTYSVALLGVDISLQELRLNPFHGRIYATGLEISNPPGYRSDFLAVANMLYFEVSMVELIFSLARHIRVDSLVVSGVRINYEQSFNSSNIQDFIDRLGMEGGGTFDLHRVIIKDVKAQAVFSSAKVNVTVPDVQYEDFSGETGITMAGNVVDLLVKTVLKSASSLFK